MLRRVGADEESIIRVLTNLANTYGLLGRHEDALRIQIDVYSENLKLKGEEHRDTVLAINNYALSLARLLRFEEAKALLRKAIPVAQRGFGENDELTIRMRWTYAGMLITDDGTLDNCREAVTTYEDIERIARRVFGSAHPLTTKIEVSLQEARAVLRARETQPAEDPAEEVD